MNEKNKEVYIYLKIYICEVVDMNIQKIMNVNFAGKVNKVENNNTFVQRPILPPVKPDTFERNTNVTFTGK